MSYVDAAYAICLSVLALYGLAVVARRRRLWRAWERRVNPPGLAGSTAPATATPIPAAAGSSAATASGTTSATSPGAVPADPADR